MSANGILQLEQYRQMEQRASTAEAISEGLRAELRETVDARVRAEAERDEMRWDKERLDWLELNGLLDGLLVRMWASKHSVRAPIDAAGKQEGCK